MQCASNKQIYPIVVWQPYITGVGHWLQKNTS